MALTNMIERFFFFIFHYDRLHFIHLSPAHNGSRMSTFNFRNAMANKELRDLIYILADKAEYHHCECIF